MNNDDKKKPDTAGNVHRQLYDKSDKVNACENQNKEFLSQFPEVPSYPHCFVLDADGKLLHSQSTADLEAGETYSQPAMRLFVESWKG